MGFYHKNASVKYNIPRFGGIMYLPNATLGHFLSGIFHRILGAASGGNQLRSHPFRLGHT
jgi:hypothetical protein